MEEKNLQHKADHRLKKNKHFSYIYRKGEHKSSKNFTLFYVPSKFGSYRIGYSVSKKLGKANVRNKLKRRLKEIVRTKNLCKAHFNYVLLAREGAQTLDFSQLTEQITKLFEKQ